MKGKHPQTIASIRALAPLVGRSVSAVRKWVKDARWPFARRGPWRIEQLRQIKWWAQLYLSHDPAQDYHEKIGRQGFDANRPLTKMEAAKLVLMVERATWARQRRMSEAGKLHDVQECQMRRLRQIHDIKGRLVEMPRVIALSLVGLDADAIERLLSAQIQTILDELAGGDAGATPEAPP